MASSYSPARAHYDAAERLIRSVDETPQTAVALAVAHALLASIDPRKLRARRRPAPPLEPGNSPQERWLRGEP
jgi:hypothetical protein